MKIKEIYLKQINNINQFADNTIPKKWRFDDRELEVAVVPRDVRHIGDWAFSHCRWLTEVWLPKALVSVGQGVFEGCERLGRIFVYDIETVYESESKLLAIALHFAPRKELFDFAGLGTAEWYEWYDGRLLQFLKTSDEQGFDPFLAGGEEDYEDPANDIEYYRALRQREKCRMVLERLRNGKFLGNSLTFQKYLSSHEAALIALFLSLKEQAYSYIKVCGDIELITETLADRLLCELGDGCFAECRAYLLYYKENVLKENESDSDRKIWEAFKI